MSKNYFCFLVLLSWVSLNVFAAPPTSEQIKTFMTVSGADEFILDNTEATIKARNLSKKEADKERKAIKENLIKFQESVYLKVYSAEDFEKLIPMLKSDAGKLGVKKNTEFRRAYTKMFIESQEAAKPK
jgi:hypothetical protein